MLVFLPHLHFKPCLPALFQAWSPRQLPASSSALPPAASPSSPAWLWYFKPTVFCTSPSTSTSILPLQCSIGVPLSAVLGAGQLLKRAFPSFSTTAKLLSTLVYNIKLMLSWLLYHSYPLVLHSKVSLLVISPILLPSDFNNYGPVNLSLVWIPPTSNILNWISPNLLLVFLIY